MSRAYYEPQTKFPETADEAVRQFRDLFDRLPELQRVRAHAGLMLIEQEINGLRNRQPAREE